jgi:hypothetical protein
VTGQINHHDNIKIDQGRQSNEIQNEEPENQGEVYLYQISEEGICSCPRIDLNFQNRKITALLDKGAQVSIMSQAVYDELVRDGIETNDLPVVSTVLDSAFKGKTKRIKKQSLLKFQIQNKNYENIFLICPQLRSLIILGVDFLARQGLCVDFKRSCLRRETEFGVVDFPFREIVEGNANVAGESQTGSEDDGVFQFSEVQTRELQTILRPSFRQNEAAETSAT